MRASGMILFPNLISTGNKPFSVVSKLSREYILFVLSISQPIKTEGPLSSYSKQKERKCLKESDLATLCKTLKVINTKSHFLSMQTISLIQANIPTLPWPDLPFLINSFKCADLSLCSKLCLKNKQSSSPVTQSIL